MDKFLLFLSCGLAVLADIMLVWFAKTTKMNYLLFIIAFLINAVGIIIWTYSMRKGIESVTAITVYAVCTTIGCSLVGYLYFNEIFSTIKLVGLILGIISLILLNL